MIEYLKKTYGGSRKDFFGFVTEALKTEKKVFIITANPETFMIANNNQEFDKAIKNPQSMVIPDGIGIVRAMRNIKLPVIERIPGVELSEYLLKEAAIYNKKVCLFGAKQEVLDALVEKYRNQEPELNIVGAYNGYIQDRDAVFDKIVESKPDLVLVALGIPEQEILISKRLPDFDKGIFIGVGGSFDVLSGMKKRAPRLFIKYNLEWLYRIAKEPQRLKRFFDSNVRFFWDINKEYKETCRNEKN